jgi:ABC-type uncharacterized transport system substrate-binding protein
MVISVGRSFLAWHRSGRSKWRAMFNVSVTSLPMTEGVRPMPIVQSRRWFLTNLGITGAAGLCGFGVAGASGGAAIASQQVGDQPSAPLVGFLNIGAPEEREWAVAAFLEGLKETGFFENQNVIVEYRWARDHYDKLPELVSDLVRRKVAVIATGGGPGPALAAAAATKTIFIVFNHGGDPVQEGLVASLDHPGGNVTGIINLHTELEPKRLEILHEMVPEATTIGVLVNPNFPDAQTQLGLVRKAATTLGLKLHIENANTESDLAEAFANFASQRVGAVFVEGGALLRDLPVQEQAKIELVINLETAKALGLAVPATVLAQADKVIE